MVSVDVRMFYLGINFSGIFIPCSLLREYSLLYSRSCLLIYCYLSTSSCIPVTFLYTDIIMSNM